MRKNRISSFKRSYKKKTSIFKFVIVLILKKNYSMFHQSSLCFKFEKFSEKKNIFIFPLFYIFTEISLKKLFNNSEKRSFMFQNEFRIIICMIFFIKRYNSLNIDKFFESNAALILYINIFFSSKYLNNVLSELKNKFSKQNQQFHV